MKVASLMIDLSANVARLRSDMNRAQGVMNKSLGAIEKSAERTMQTINRLGGVFGAVLGGAAVNQLIRMADEWGQLESRLRLATQSTSEFSVAQDRLFQLASNTHGTMAQVSELYIRTSESLRQMGYSSDQTLGQVEALTYALNINATDSQKSKSVIDAWSKAMLLGKMSAQEYNTIVAYSPRLQQALADSLGVSNQQLTAMARGGKITAKEMIGVTDQIERLAQEAEKMPVTVGESFGRMRQHIMKYIGEMNQAGGVTDKITQYIDKFADNIDLIAIGLGALSMTVIPAVTAKIVAMTAALMVNPFGLLAVGIAAVIGYLITLRDDTEKFNRQIDTFGAAWDTLRDTIIDAWADVANFIGPTVKKIISWFYEIEDGAYDSASETVGAFEIAFGGLAESVDWLRSHVAGVFSSIWAVAKNLATNMVNELFNAFESIKAMASNMAHGVIRELNAILPGKGIDIGAPYVAKYKEVKDELEAAIEAYKGAATTATQSALEQNKANRKIEREIKNLERWYEELGEEVIVVAGATDELTKSTTKNTKAVDEAIRRAEEFAKARESELKSQRDGISNIHLQAQALEDQVAVFGRGKTALDQLAIARLQEQKAMLSGFAGSEEAIDLINQEIAAIERRTKATGALEVLEAEKKKNEKMVSEWNKTVEEYDRVFRDGFAGMLNNGKSGWKSFTKSLATTFRTSVADQIYKMLAQPFVVRIAASIAGIAGGGTAQAGGLGGLSGIGSLFTNFGGSMAGAAQNLGASLANMSGSIGDLGANIVMNADKIGSALNMAGSAFNYGMGALDLFKGNYGAGIGAIGGQFIGGPIGGMIGKTLGGMLDKAFKGEKRSGGGFGYNLGDASAYFGGGPSGGYGGQQTLDAMTQVLKGQANLINSVLSGAGVNAYAGHVAGAFESSDKGRGGTYSGGVINVEGNEIKFGTDAKGQGYGGKSGSVEEMFANMEKDLAYSALEAFQVVGNQMPKMISDMLSGLNIRALSPEQAAQTVGEIQAIVDNVNLLMVALNELPFTSLAGLSFDLTASLLEAAGSMEVLVGGINAYYQGFYSEQERFDIAAKQLSGSISELGFKLPTTRDGFRGLVESLDATDEANHKAIAGLFEMSGAAAQYYDYVEERAQEASEMARERAEEETAYGQARADTLERFRGIFHTEQEKFDALAKSLGGSISDLGHELPATRNGFRRLIESSVDAEGRFTDAAFSLMGLSDGASQYYAELEKQADDAIKKAQDTARNITSAAQEIASSFQKATDSIQSNVGNLYERIALGIMKDDGERYGYHKQTFDNLARQLSQSTDMDQIQDLVSKMTSSASSAYNLLDEDVRKGGKGQEYLNTLDQIQREADARLEVAKSQAAQDKERELKVVGEAIAKEVVKIMSGAGDSMKEAAGDISGAAQEFSYAIGTLALSKYNEVNS